MKKIIIVLLTIVPLIMNSQEKNLPFSEIGDYPSEYTTTNVISRLIDGLGYRFYWSTESLTENDLNYKPSEDSRSTMEVIEHIYGLSLMIVASFDGKEFDFKQNKLDYANLRKETLNNLMYIKSKLNETSDLSQINIEFSQGDNKLKFPFWNHLNGPMADAIWHCGQVVTNRRASGNPLNSKVNVFLGKTMP
jgi:hypothetical protein